MVKKMKGDIHNYKIKLRYCLKNLMSSDRLSEKNKRFIYDFHTNCFMERLSIAQTHRYVTLLVQLADVLVKDFDKADKNDIIRVVQEIDSRDYTEWTKEFYRVALKKFYTWLRGAKETPSEVEWLKCYTKNGKHKLPEELLTVDEIKSMIEITTRPRDKAFLAMLYESGCRVGEIGSMCLRNVSFDKYGAVLTVDGKTGQRRVRIISSVPYLANWMSVHPLKDNPDAPLWVNLNFKKKHSVLNYGTIARMIKTASKEAGIKKRVYPHLFRHSRATHLASHLTEAQMKQYFGWVQGSYMASVYVHLSGRDMDSTLLKLNGVEVEETDEERNGNDCQTDC
ncbi:MAG TPA: hypothetical protein ENN30_01975 [Candidatus Woesearchaeota archaeon]|nr:hypothetical protein [Candidatus Woesearchaeota archaeon]